MDKLLLRDKIMVHFPSSIDLCGHSQLTNKYVIHLEIADTSYKVELSPDIKAFTNITKLIHDNTEISKLDDTFI